MKLRRDTDFRIAKGSIDNVFTETAPLDYKKWVRFIDAHQNSFIWKEDTVEGKKSLKNINNVPDNFKSRVLSTLNKGVCFSEFDNKKGTYNISVVFYEDLNWIKIQFARTPRVSDLNIFVKMANYLSAHLFVDGNKLSDVFTQSNPNLTERTKLIENVRSASEFLKINGFYRSDKPKNYIDSHAGHKNETNTYYFFKFFKNNIVGRFSSQDPKFDVHSFLEKNPYYVLKQKGKYEVFDTTIEMTFGEGQFALQRNFKIISRDLLEDENSQQYSYFENTDNKIT